MRSLSTPPVSRAIFFPGQAAVPPGRNRWQRWFVDPVVLQLTQGITPEKICLSLVIGSLCAFFPILGAATPLCLLAGVFLRLNQPVIQLVNGVTAPLYPFVAYGFVRLGDRLVGARAPSLEPRLMAVLLRHDPLRFLQWFGPVAGHAALGWAIVAPLWVTAGYVGLAPLVRSQAARRLTAPARSP
jgi:uncharacterized protein (DUF2062 family)